MNFPWELSPFAFFSEEGDPNYQKELDSCREFTLYEHFREGGPTSIKASPEIEDAYRKLAVNANDAQGQKDRLAMVSILDQLGGLGRLWEVAPESKERDMLIEQLGKKLIPDLVEQIGVPIAKGLALSASKRETALQDVATSFKSGITSLNRKFAPKLGEAPDGRSLLPLGQMLVPVAVAEFRKTRERPTKSAVRVFLERMGYSLRKKETWDDNFKKAGLGGLPW